MKNFIFCFAIFFTMNIEQAISHDCPQFTNSNNAEIYDFPVAQGTPSSKWVYQEFHKNGMPARDSVSGWRIRFSERGVIDTGDNDGSGWTLAIEEAWFTTSEGKERKVLGGLWPVQIWVPYEQEQAVILDLGNGGAKLTPILPQYMTWNCSSETGPNFTSPHDIGVERPIFVKELHDYGMAEMRLFPGGADDIWRRGTELVVWANSDAGNYDNYIKYHFRDDGQILAFVGTSGWNSTALMRENARTGWTPHLHSTLWRVHPKIGNWQHNDKVYKVSYNQSMAQNNRREKLNIDQFKSEIAFNDEPDEHLSILFEDSETILGEKMGYAVRRLSEGTARHRVASGEAGPENQILNDYFLLKFHQGEIDPKITNTTSITDRQVPPESLEQGGVVLFAATSVKHIPRNEDFVARPRKNYQSYPNLVNPNGDGNDRLSDNAHHAYYAANAALRNATKIAWHGIELSPRNIHRRTPFSSNKPCQPTPDCAELEDSEVKSQASRFTWTPWLNRDRATGKGDYELLSDFRKAGLACEKPIDVECQVVSSKSLSMDTKTKYLCEPRVGGVCVNKEQTSGKCDDFEVRFLCLK